MVNNEAARERDGEVPRGGVEDPNLGSLGDGFLGLLLDLHAFGQLRITPDPPRLDENVGLCARRLCGKYRGFE
jgi:hypothetical protein